jgi:DNA-binding CsgD family transcriptional regulator/tetratricopeptide (TPR) repeat protein
MAGSPGRQQARVFAGREGELAVLRSAWESARGGSGRAVIVEGGAGFGKTALVKKFAAEVPMHVRVNGIDVEPSAPWSILKEIVVQLPEGSLLDGSISLDPLALPSLAGDVLAECLRRGDSLMLVLDDAQWADEQSMIALLYAALRLQHDPVLLVIVYQTSEDRPSLMEASGLPGVWRQVFDDPCGLCLSLGGLPPEDILRLATANGHPQLSIGEARRLYESTAGNPEHIHQLLPMLSSHSVFTDEDPLPVPRTLASAIVARLTACSLPTQKLVSAAAVIGPRFSLATLRDVSLVDAPRSHVDEAVDAGLLEQVPGSGGREYRFSRPVMREAIYHYLNSRERTELHRRCAMRHGAEALRHRIAAADGKDDVLAEDLRQAAMEKMKTGDIPGACYYLKAALDSASPGPVRVGLLLMAVESLLVAGKERDTEEYLDELRRLPTDPWRDYVLGQQRMLAGDLGQATALLQGALDALGRGDAAAPGAPADLQARIATQLAVIGMVTLSYTDMTKYGTIAVAGESDEAWVRGYACFAKTVGMALAGESAQALALLAGAGESGDVAGLEGLAARGMIHLWTDDLEGAARDLQAMVRRATQGDALRVYQAVGYLGEVEYRRGRFGEAVYFTELAVGNAEDNERYWDYPILHALAAYPRAARAEWDEASEHAKRSQTWARRMGMTVGLAIAGAAQAAIAQARGDPTQLLIAAEQIEAHYDSREPGTHLFGPIRADALAQLGRIDEAAQALQRFLEGPAASGRRSAMMSAGRVAARIAIGREDYGQAREECRRARALADEIGMPLEAARIDLLLAQCEYRAGHEAATDRELRTAYTQFKAIGATAYAELAERSASDWGIAVAAAPDPFRWLTRREAEIARLACEGKTYQAIADSLGIAFKTVETHHRNIFLKLNVKGRAELKRLLNQDGGAI